MGPPEQPPKRRGFDDVFDAAHEKRVLVVLTFLVASAVFVLSLLCLIAGHSAGMMEGYAIARLNASEFLDDAIVVTTNTTTSAAKRDVIEAAVVARGDDDVDEEDILLSRRDILDPPPPITGSLGGGLLNGSLTGSLEGSLEQALGDIVDNITAALGDNLAAAENEVAAQIRADLGIEQWYSLHLTTFCIGNYTPNATAPNAQLKIINCTSLIDGSSPPVNTSGDYFVLGDTTFDYSALDMRAKLSSIAGHASAGFKLLQATYGMGIGGAGLMILLSPAAAVLGERYYMPQVLLALAGITSTSLISGSTFVSSFVSIAKSAVNTLGDGLNLHMSAGSRFLAMTWSAAALSTLLAVAWYFQVSYAASLSRKRQVAALRAEADASHEKLRMVRVEDASSSGMAEAI